MRVLSWNLFHGRSVPDSRQELLDEFAAALAGWAWDVALLQECPPWWPEPLARACGADERHVLTSRSGLLVARRFVAVRRPDLIRSNGGGCNAILVRRGSTSEHRAVRLCRLPERRWMHAVRCAGGIWVANIHASGRDELALRDCTRAGAALLAWAGPSSPAVFGGDFNLRAPVVPGFALAGGRHVDHFMLARMRPIGSLEVPDRGSLSDHEPVMLSVDDHS
jgi:endonuclease/exonuclease/phosphatase family metal-dependent hydrolase